MRSDRPTWRMWSVTSAAISCHWPTRGERRPGRTARPQSRPRRCRQSPPADCATSIDLAGFDVEQDDCVDHDASPPHGRFCDSPIEEAIIHCAFFTYDVQHLVWVGGVCRDSAGLCWFLHGHRRHCCSRGTAPRSTVARPKRRRRVPSTFSSINNTNETDEEAGPDRPGSPTGWRTITAWSSTCYTFDARDHRRQAFLWKDRLRSLPMAFPLTAQLGRMPNKSEGHGDTARRVGRAGRVRRLHPRRKKARIEQMVRQCRDLDFALLSSTRSPDPFVPKENSLHPHDDQWRKGSPGSPSAQAPISLDKAEARATTFLWEKRGLCRCTFHRPGDEHRTMVQIAAEPQGLVPDLKRLTEDHTACACPRGPRSLGRRSCPPGVHQPCSAPQIYGNPWLLRDDQFPKLRGSSACFRKYREILVEDVPPGGTIRPGGGFQRRLVDAFDHAPKSRLDAGCLRRAARRDH